MKIAIIGTGIAGNVAAYRLAQEHEITVFEAADRIGGHTNTIDVEYGGRSYAVDTGFIVFNGRTYPNFVRLLEELGVAWQDSDMSFSVRDECTGLEYSGSSLNTLFAQRRNLFRPAFYGMIRDILRFNRESPAVLDAEAADWTLEEFLHQGGYGRAFVEQFIIPMGAAIWSARPEAMRSMPARFFVRFFQNHGMLTVNDRPVWRVIRGGSARYVERLTAGHRDRILLNTPVEQVRRLPGHVEIQARGRPLEHFDHVFFACHSDQALSLLADPAPLERKVLGAVRYQRNEAVLHTDASLMPRHRRAWAAWNYHLLSGKSGRAAVTYNMNILQGLDASVPFLVTLNHTSAIDPARIIRRVEYAHPVFTSAAVEAQGMQECINGMLVNGARRSWYCGAYWRNGFHEDGVVSALNALTHFNERIDHEQRDFRRVG